MAKDKEKSINPAQAARKAEKLKSIKKGKAEAASRRNGKLARQNPDRLQKQLDELKAIETNGGSLTNHEKKIAEELEKDIKAIKKAREVLGDAAPQFNTPRGEGRAERGRGGGVLGKRGRDWAASDDSDDDVPEDVKSIPMPRDTPPPIPKEVLDRWYQTRRDKAGHTRDRTRGNRDAPGAGTRANDIPLGGPDRGFGDGNDSRPAPVARTVYQAKPMVRDLRKEAVQAFVPGAVRAKMEKVKGIGKLVEPEEADKLEQEGYGHKILAGKNAQHEDERTNARTVKMEDVEHESVNKSK